MLPPTSDEGATFARRLRNLFLAEKRSHPVFFCSVSLKIFCSSTEKDECVCGLFNGTHADVNHAL